jgi:DNA-binding SARP family transcriptional activator
LDGFPYQRANLLLCYLLLNHRYPQHRERLAAAFWGEFSASVARKQLRNSLWKLRMVLKSAGAEPDDYLQVSEESISLIGVSQFWLDVDVFEASLAGSQDLSPHELNAEQAGQVEQAVQLYTGDLLESVYEDWCIYDRERLRLLHQSALIQLMSYYGLTGDYGRGLKYGRAVLALDHTLEKVHRQIMRLEWLYGDRSAALAQYRLCAQILRDELGIPPMEETRNLYEKMLHGRIRAPEHLLAAEFDLRPQAAPPELPPLLSQDLLQKLQHLQEMMERNQAELHQIEGLISQLVPNRLPGKTRY